MARVCIRMSRSNEPSLSGGNAAPASPVCCMDHELSATILSVVPSAPHDVFRVEMTRPCDHTYTCIVLGLAATCVVRPHVLPVGTSYTGSIRAGLVACRGQSLRTPRSRRWRFDPRLVLAMRIIALP